MSISVRFKKLSEIGFEDSILGRIGLTTTTSSMTKSDLIARLAEQNPQLLAKDAELAVKVILDAMSSTLSRGERIEVRGFGSFGLNYRPPRQGRNPKTGDKVKVQGKYIPHFKSGKELRERVARPGHQGRVA